MGAELDDEDDGHEGEGLEKDKGTKVGYCNYMGRKEKMSTFAACNFF